MRSPDGYLFVHDRAQQAPPPHAQPPAEDMANRLPDATNVRYLDTSTLRTMLNTWTATDYGTPALALRGHSDGVLPEDRTEARRLLLAVRRELATRQSCW
jgi:hypothetical protein